MAKVLLLFSSSSSCYYYYYYVIMYEMCVSYSKFTSTTKIHTDVVMLRSNPKPIAWV